MLPLVIKALQQNTETSRQESASAYVLTIPTHFLIQTLLTVFTIARKDYTRMIYLMQQIKGALKDARHPIGEIILRDMANVLQDVLKILRFLETLLITLEYVCRFAKFHYTEIKVSQAIEHVYPYALPIQSYIMLKTMI